MNWQALNPWRLVGATTAFVSNASRHMTKKRLLVATATGLLGTVGSGGYVVWKNAHPVKSGPAQVADANPTEAPQPEADPSVELSPIPDQENPGAPAASPYGQRFGSNQFVSTSEPNSEQANSGNADNDRSGAADTANHGFGATNELRPRPQFLGGDAARMSNPLSDEGAPTAATSTADPTLGGSASTNDGGTNAGPSEGDDRGGAVDLRRASELAESAPAEPSVAIPPEADTSTGQEVDQGASGERPAPRADASGRGADGAGSQPPGWRTFRDATTPGVPSPPAEPAPTESSPPRALVPVEPTQLQPPPPEEHVRLPDEASPNLMPGRLANPTLANPAPTSGGEAPEYRPGSFSRSRDVPGAASFGPNATPEPPLAGGSLSTPSPAGDAREPAAAIGQPGAKHLEGAQTPTLTLEKMAPEEIQVGQPATFIVKVRNTGRVVAHQVVVMDQVPQGTRLLDTAPAASRGADGSLQWQLGSLEPGQETTVSMQILPEQEGEVGSVARVAFQSEASVRTVATRPQISIEHRAPQRVLIGQPIVIQLTITNSGSGAANGLVIEEAVPEGLGHPAGPELEYPIGTLRPNESRRVELTLKALRPGVFQNLLVARTDKQTLAEDRIGVEVQAPQMVVGVTGPKVRYLDRQATYSVSVSNPGTAAATNVEIVAQLPRGLKFVSADHHGQYDPQRHAVLWGLAELPPGVAGTSQLVVVPTEPGEQRLRVEGRGDLNLEHALEQAVVVETLSELQFAVADTADPIEVGSETTYDVRIMNRGSRTASNIQVAIEFPPELEPLGGEGATRVTARSGQLSIEPLARLAPNAQVAYQIHVRGVRKGDPRIRVRLTSDESPNPVTKEESTRVYADE